MLFCILGLNLAGFQVICSVHKLMMQKTEKENKTSIRTQNVIKGARYEFEKSLHGGNNKYEALKNTFLVTQNDF